MSDRELSPQQLITRDGHKWVTDRETYISDHDAVCAGIVLLAQVGIHAPRPGQNVNWDDFHGRVHGLMDLLASWVDTQYDPSTNTLTWEFRKL